MSYSARLSPLARVPRAYRTIERRPTVRGARAVQCGLGVVVVRANSRHTPPNAVGRGATAAIPRPVGGAGVGGGGAWSAPLYTLVRVPRAYRTMEKRPTARRARAARAWRGCGVGQRAARSSPRRRPRLDRTDCATGRLRLLQKIVIDAFKPRGARPACVSHHGVSADRPWSTARYGHGVVVLWTNAQR